ncbi:metallophosphoesterase family protein [Pelagicoccus albus]|uniref:Metallophosphoesterase family protein n=1 Tax=Pelagicoccus albus TaxID=415222 RepID=A0A7X1B7T4_9BACT|nr:metallophosphoesterase [Pelagicoccus albus]MBC2607156.1 metallophosphoesterase family protein [Pelagicoccus albus]
MKVLLVSDLHMNLKQFRWVEESASRYDLVVIAGDLLDLASQFDKQEQIQQITPILERIKTHCPLLVSSGNHDGNTRTPEGEEHADWIKDLRAKGIVSDGQYLDLANYRFTVCPWWNDSQTRREMAKLLKDSQPAAEVSWIWIHHAPPRGSAIARTRKGDAGDPFLSRLIGTYKPTAVLCGHIHNAPFYNEGAWAERVGQTWVFNPGKQPGEVPTHIDFDTETNTATYTNAEEREGLALGQ